MRAAIEMRTNAGALEGVLEESGVLLRRAQQHRHLVESDSARGFLQDPARDLHALTRLPRRREPHELAGAIANRGRLLREQIFVQTREVAVAVVVAIVDR